MPSLAATNHRLRLLIAFALLAGIVFTAPVVHPVDLYWQLPEGLSILANGRLPHAPPAAFGLTHQPYVDEYSLYEIGLALLYRLGGLTAIWMAFGAVFLLIFAIPLAAALRSRRDLIHPTQLSLLAFAGVFMANRAEERPELLGILLFTLLIHLLRTAKAGSSPAFLLRLAVLFVVWSNVHSSYLIGLFTLALWTFTRILGRGNEDHLSPRHTILVPLAVAGGAVLINPYGPRRVLFTFFQENDPGSNLLSAEMWPIWDQSTLSQVCLGATALLIVLAAAPKPRPATWAIVVAIAMLLLAAHNIRHMGFLAVALLNFAVPPPPRSIAPSPSLRLFVVSVLLVPVCSFLLIIDNAALRRALSARPTRTAPLVAPRLAQFLLSHAPAGILCHDTAGDYLGYLSGGTLHPLLDTGQGRFSDATKRLYFFVVMNPRAFNLALDRLHLDAVLVTRPAVAWIPALALRPDWHLARQDPDGLLFFRGTTGRADSIPAITGYPRLPSTWNCALATLCPDPAKALDLLDQSRASSWTEPFLVFLRPWIDHLPVVSLHDFLSRRPGPGNPLLRELLLTRLQPTPPPPLAPSATRLEKLARIQRLLQLGDKKGARTLFLTIAVPHVSPLYFLIRDQLNPDAAHDDNRMTRWQDWNAGGEELLTALPPLLNQNLARPLNPLTFAPPKSP